jgi:hypothetical protein
MGGSQRQVAGSCDRSDEPLDSIKGKTLFENLATISNCLCGLVIRVPGYRSRGPGSIPGATRYSEK